MRDMSLRNNLFGLVLGFLVEFFRSRKREHVHKQYSQILNTGEKKYACLFCIEMFVSIRTIIDAL